MSVFLFKQAERLGAWLIDGLFPIFCAGCGAERKIVCDACLSEVPLVGRRATCPICERKRADNIRPCKKCAKITPLSGIIAGFSYGDRIMRELMRRLKFDGLRAARASIELMSRRVVERWRQVLPSGTEVCVVYVPTTARRRRERGFDQTEWIADEVAAALGVMVTRGVLQTVGNHQRQSWLKPEKRQENIRGKFEIIDKTAIEGKKIILIDDIWTTGATMQEAARVLKVAGANEIWGFVLIRA